MSQMLPEDLMAGLAGGGGPLPGDMMAGLGPAPEEAEGAPLPSDGNPGGGSAALEEAIALLDEAAAAESDQEDQQIIRQCSAKLQSILAKNQADEDAALGGKVSPKAIRKQAGGAGAGGNY